VHNREKLYNCCSASYRGETGKLKSLVYGQQTIDNLQKPGIQERIGSDIPKKCDMLNRGINRMPRLLFVSKTFYHTREVNVFCSFWTMLQVKDG
jgi:hypothetical protein